MDVYPLDYLVKKIFSKHLLILDILEDSKSKILLKTQCFLIAANILVYLALTNLKIDVIFKKKK